MKLISRNELARKLGMYKSKIAYYDAMGLIEPVTKVGGMFVYDKEQVIIRLRLIKKFRNMGLTLEQMRAQIEAEKRLNKN